MELSQLQESFVDDRDKRNNQQSLTEIETELKNLAATQQSIDTQRINLEQQKAAFAKQVNEIAVQQQKFRKKLELDNIQFVQERVDQQKLILKEPLKQPLRNNIIRNTTNFIHNTKKKYRRYMIRFIKTLNTHFSNL